MTALGSFSTKSSNSANELMSASIPESDRDRAATQYVAKGHERICRVDSQSSSSSARSMRDSGTSIPSAFAVVRLMINSNLTGRKIGRSAGFAPLRM